MPIMLIAISLAALAAGPEAERAKAARDTILSAENRAIINARCGEGADQAGPIRLDRGALVCRDGRRFEDPETRSMSQQIGARTKALVDGVMTNPAVRDAINRRNPRAMRAGRANN
jgi:hypothetical protein